MTLSDFPPNCSIRNQHAIRRCTSKPKRRHFFFRPLHLNLQEAPERHVIPRRKQQLPLSILSLSRNREIERTISSTPFSIKLTIPHIGTDRNIQTRHSICTTKNTDALAMIPRVNFRIPPFRRPNSLRCRQTPKRTVLDPGEPTSRNSRIFALVYPRERYGNNAQMSKHVFRVIPNKQIAIMFSNAKITMPSPISLTINHPVMDPRLTIVL